MKLFRRGWTIAWLTFWAFLALHLVGDWPGSWWTVTAPLWITGLASVVFLFFAGLAATIAVKRVSKSTAYQAAKVEARDALREFIRVQKQAH